ncbi:hypothetical protein P7K49_018451 [Saguinus oedipus]|uniref:Uncharacterized protein n=1 Tax=Saguinus oedipus TaxID=9490 RepID=A0ABQ9V6D5_SAGOE|nr:hypothetical protein P7K49_018451 [Saguinus oedipus]
MSSAQQNSKYQEREVRSQNIKGKRSPAKEPGFYLTGSVAGNTAGSVVYKAHSDSGLRSSMDVAQQEFCCAKLLAFIMKTAGTGYVQDRRSVEEGSPKPLECSGRSLGYALRREPQSCSSGQPLLHKLCISFLCLYKLSEMTNYRMAQISGSSSRSKP